ncbi:tetratricopeptide repeat protein [Paraburkholderia oxyphila]|uniref:tetratricopeptide repeat protein n=1 Tax=Paraburkholderia oxyphila TaxID=614212 RepID=UPI0004859290|nr:tetratricopeptide repeat protein [Paraburkholderia oxyphila]
MRIHRILILSMSALLLSACAEKFDTMTPEIHAKIYNDLKAGNLTLDCTVNCMLTWNKQVAALQALDMAEQWDDLATRVVQIGYRQDLAYYYLGQAAQGLSYHDAAIKYYKEALTLTTTQSPLEQCTHAIGLQNPCQGVDITSVVPVLIKASEDALAKSTKSAKVKKKASSAGPNWAVPAPAPSNWAAPPPASSN